MFECVEMSLDCCEKNGSVKMDFNMPLRHATRQRCDKKINAAQKNRKIRVAIPFACSIVKMSFRCNLYYILNIIYHCSYTIVPG